MCSCSSLWSASSYWRGSGGLTGSLCGLPPHQAGPSVARFTICSRLAAQTIVPPVVSPPRPRRLEGQRLLRCSPGARSKADEEPLSGSTPRALPVPTINVSTSGSLLLTSMRLFGDGKHGRTEPIQTFRGPACRTTFTCRRNTPLYRLKTPSQQVAVVLSALAEGLDPSAAERVFGYRQATITSLSHARWETCSDHSRTLLLSSPAPTPAVRKPVLAWVSSSMFA
jgi:hypothetical protein